MHTKQQWQLFKEKHYNAAHVPIQLKTICSQKLELFSRALDASNFSQHFEGLAADTKRLLISAVGEQQLDAPVLTVQLLRTDLFKDVAQDYIKKYLPTSMVADCLQRSLILDNCKCKSFTPLPPQTYFSADAYHVVGKADGASCDCLPALLSQQTNFSGETFPAFAVFGKSELGWLIHNYIVTKQFAGFITPISPIDKNNPFEQGNLKDNRQKLWIRKENGDVLIEKIIQHTNVIKRTVFSKNGKYLATRSKGPNSELILTNISLQDDVCVVTDTFLSGYRGKIKAICFNNRSTMLAAGVEKSIYLWDTDTCSLTATIDCREPEIECICFNHDDTRLAALCFCRVREEKALRVWNIADIRNITPITDYLWGELDIHIAFNASGDKIIIEIDDDVILFDALIGDVIMETNNIANGSGYANAVLMPGSLSILVSQTGHENNNDNKVDLWDVNSGKRIATLLENEKDLQGIGVSASGRSVVAIAVPYNTIQIDLYDDNAAVCLNWIARLPNLLQKYFLLRLYRTFKLNDFVDLHPDSPEHRILQGLPMDKEGNVKAFVEKYLLKRQVQQETSC